ncbi:uncharacterized protein TRIADDRAFT_53182 [Trichoplax adhaerens]|uniref:GP-PDE domain-containing protein n=1 Tax=Trichoplax adhaerens TaxID=10228 RepID=B3RNJ0_TRIAD|nr:hypothetical protein TRIADDRAFT_53182 [Trichoplax adhaerens]EDV27461.1 hypothetical protein TRIADDRAFT_53182 [Trichoplax adhaerens]|eukprot:XP_002109295.1 hypothetical protein TRIADDRAFT_53182 [Trichoplax adhaerens]
MAASETTISVTFQVEYQPENGNEKLFLCGDLPVIGEWQPTKALRMTQSTRSHWQANINLQPRTTVKYRYVISEAYQVQDEVQSEPNQVADTIIVKKWESFNICRHQTIRSSSSTMKVDDGAFGMKDNEIAIKKGWLTTESYVNIYLNNSIKESVVFWSQKTFIAPAIKVTPYYVQQYPNTGVNTNVYIKILDEGNHSPKLQGNHGTFCDNKSFYAFTFGTFNVKELGVKLEFHDLDKSNSTTATAYIVPSRLSESTGRVTSPIVCCTSGNLLGEVTIEYLVVNPIPKIKLPEVYIDVFKSLSRPLLIGHRGMGAHDAQDAEYIVEENTMEAFKRAFEEKVDMVEFDIQMDADGEIVIYHDFNIDLHALRARDNIKCHRCPVKNLSVQQLKAYAALVKLDKGLGFNLEIKFPTDERHEDVAINYQDINRFVDKILKVVYHYAGERKIFFSCFNPDVCIALFMKQPSYPVVYLTCGISDKDLHVIELIKKFNLAICTWGNGNNKLDNIKLQRSYGIDGIICDRCDRELQACEKYLGRIAEVWMQF